jgi:hypothetical protein
VDGKPYVFNYGLADVASHRPVTRSTLVELGSVSKTFTVTLAAYAHATGHLAWSNPVFRHLPELRGSAFGRVPLLDLPTHTPGGLPLQLPANIHTDAQLFHYLRAWRPAYPPGAVRTYNNIGIGVLGLIAAACTALSLPSSAATFSPRSACAKPSSVSPPPASPITPRATPPPTRSSLRAVRASPCPKPRPAPPPEPLADV